MTRRSPPGVPGPRPRRSTLKDWPPGWTLAKSDAARALVARGRNTVELLLRDAVREIERLGAELARVQGELDRYTFANTKLGPGGNLGPTED